MAEYRFNLDVHIFDTDCFGVMWHGAYIKWLEMGRVNLFKSIGIELTRPEDEGGYIYPVVEQNLKFRSPAKMADVLTLTTRVQAEGHKLIFHQDFRNLETDKITLEAVTTCVMLDRQWKTQRRLPEFIQKALETSPH